MIKPCVCVQASHGPLSQEDQWLSEKRKDLHGTNALLILLPPPLSVGLGQLEEEEEEDVTLLSALVQLRQVQQASCLHSPVPLAVVVTDNEEGRTSDQGLVEGNYIFGKHILCIALQTSKTYGWKSHLYSIFIVLSNFHSTHVEYID